MLNTLFTLQELCYFWIKKSLFLWFFFFFSFFRRNPCIVDRKFLLATLAECGNHWFLQRWILIDFTCKLPFGGQYRSFFSFFFFFAHQCAFHLFQIHHNTNGRFRSFLLVCFYLDQIVLTDRKRYVPLFPSLNSYCHFLDLIFSWAVKKA